MVDRISTNDLAQGRWKEIMQAFGVPANLLNGRRQACPFCGGDRASDRFRWTDYRKSGGYLCSQCGAGNGFQFLEKLYSWPFKETAKRIDDLLLGNWRISMDPASRPPIAEVSDVPKSVRDCALWLRKFHPDKLEGWLDLHEIEVRWWLSTQS